MAVVALQSAVVTAVGVEAAGAVLAVEAAAGGVDAAEDPVDGAARM